MRLNRNCANYSRRILTPTLLVHCFGRFRRYDDGKNEETFISRPPPAQIPPSRTDDWSQDFSLFLAPLVATLPSSSVSLSRLPAPRLDLDESSPSNRECRQIQLSTD